VNHLRPVYAKHLFYTVVEIFPRNVNSVKPFSFQVNVCITVVPVVRNSVCIVATEKLSCGRCPTRRNRWLICCQAPLLTIGSFDVTSGNITARCVWAVCGARANEITFLSGPSVFKVQGEVYRFIDPLRCLTDINSPRSKCNANI